mmetsp:Transcript_59655/g.136827  ORF Transcript_59655/g.136827 Transcript_59655/m.136827 type:complete len:303 (-) Transcript_59655:571-1479(-)
MARCSARSSEPGSSDSSMLVVTPPVLGRRLSNGPPVATKASRSLSLLTAGAASGGVSKLLTAPIDRLKIIYQVSPQAAFSLRSGIGTLQAIVRRSGALALWRGNSAAMLRDVPYAAIVFTSFALYEDGARTLFGSENGICCRLAAGSAAGATATCVTYPLDVLRARFAAEKCSLPPNTGYTQAVRHILRVEGVGALYSGLRPTLLGIVPYSGLSFAAFESIKAQLRHRKGARADTDLSASQRFAAGGFAGLFAQVCPSSESVSARLLRVASRSSGCRRPARRQTEMRSYFAVEIVCGCDTGG